MTVDPLLEAACRHWSGDDIHFDTTETDLGVMLVATTGPQPSTALGSLYLAKASGAVYIVPSYIRNHMHMDEVSSDPQQNVGLSRA